MIEIKVLGGGCPKCKRLEQITREAADELGLEYNVIHVTELDEIMAYDVLSTPGLVLNEKLVNSGSLPRKDEVTAWLKAAN